MKLKYFKIKHAPSAKDKNRYKLSLACSESTAKALVEKLGKVSSRPFPSSEEKYTWSLFLYDTDRKFRKVFKKKLNKIAKTGQKKLDQKNKKDTADITEQDKNLEKYLADYTSLKEDHLFENFIVGTNTRFTYAACKAVAEKPGENYNPLFIYGGVGLGKTHLMHAIGNHVKENFPEYLIVYISTEKFIGEVINAIEAGTINELRNRYKEIDLLLIDDIQFLEQSESTQEEFFHIFNVMHDVKKQIVITSDKPPKKLATLEDRLKSRFEWGLTTDVKSPNFETRKAILKRKANQSGLDLSEEITNYIAERLTSNIRELEGIINRIMAYQELSDEIMDLELVKTIIKNILPEDESLEEEDKVNQNQKIKKEPSQQSGSGKDTSSQAPDNNYQNIPHPQFSAQSQSSRYSAPQKVCSRCGNPQIRFIPQYQRWYCGNCGMYIDPATSSWQSYGTPPPGSGGFQQSPPPPQAPPPSQQAPPPPQKKEAEKEKCPDCNNNLEYISQYDRFYCRNCSKYTEPKAEDTPPPPPPPSENTGEEVEESSSKGPAEEVKESRAPEKSPADEFKQKVIGIKREDVRKIKAGYILPEGSKELFGNIVNKLHKLARQKKFNFYIQPEFTHFYSSEVNINYDKLTHLANNNNVDIALCMEPGDGPSEFKSKINSSMEEKNMPLEILPREEIKDSFALNIMLDIAICAKKNK